MINWFAHMYPYGNLHELNLDWVIDTVKRGEKEIADFIGTNTIKYADPILWNIESQYEANTVVVDGQTGNAYISVKAVPSGVHLNREEYWTQIYNYEGVIAELKHSITPFDEGLSDSNTNASVDYSIGDLLWYDNKLYVVKRPIEHGTSLLVNDNIFETSIDKVIEVINKSITTYDLGVKTVAPYNIEKNALIFKGEQLYQSLDDINTGDSVVDKITPLTISDVLVDIFRRIDSINEQFDTSLSINDLIVNGTVKNHIILNGYPTHGQGNDAVSLFVASSENQRAFINGYTPETFIDRAPRDNVVFSTQVYADKNNNTSGYQYDVVEVTRNSMTTLQNINPDHFVKGSIIQLFTTDPQTTDTLAGTYLGFAESIENNTITVSAWFSQGDTTHSEVTPVNITHAVLNIKTNNYSTLDDIYIPTTAPAYLKVFNGGEVNLWDYKGISATLKDFVIRVAQGISNITGLSIRNESNVPVGVGVNTRKLRIGFVSQNDNISLRMDNPNTPILINSENGAIEPFDKYGVLQNPFIKTGKQLLLTNGTDLTLDTLDYDSIITVYNNSDNNIVLSFPLVLNLYGKSLSMLTLSKRSTMTLYYVSSTNIYYYINGDVEKTIATSLGLSSVFATSSDLDLETLSWSDNECKTIYNINSSSIYLTSSTRSIRTIDGNVTSVEVPPATVVGIYGGTTFIVSVNRNDDTIYTRPNDTMLFKFLTESITLASLNMLNLSGIILFNNNDTDSYTVTDTSIYDIDSDAPVTSYTVQPRKFIIVMFTGNTYYISALN